MTLQEILAIRALITVAHHVPGRVRLRLDPQVRSLPAAAELGNLRANEHGILATRLNPLARALVIEYDSAKISPALLEEFLAGTDDARVAALAEQFAKIFGVTPQS